MDTYMSALPLQGTCKQLTLFLHLSPTQYFNLWCKWNQKASMTLPWSLKHPHSLHCHSHDLHCHSHGLYWPSHGLYEQFLGLCRTLLWPNWYSQSPTASTPTLKFLQSTLTACKDPSWLSQALFNGLSQPLTALQHYLSLYWHSRNLYGRSHSLY